jgi:hypothetical protein
MYKAVVGCGGFQPFRKSLYNFYFFLFSPMGIFSAKPTTLTTKIEMYIKNNVQTILFAWWVCTRTHHKPTTTHHASMQKATGQGFLIPHTVRN